jgi:hypothetical protein
MRKTLLTILTILTLLTYIETANSSNLNLTITTNKQLYNVGESVTIMGSLTQDGTPLSDGLVTIQVKTPKNATFIIRTFTTGQTPTGPWPIEITNFTPCDSNGNPTYTFQPGGQIGFKLTIKNSAATSYDVIVPINLYYANGAPFSIFIAYNGTINANSKITSMIWPLSIPTDAVKGTAYAYANALSDLPENMGLSYSPENSANFTIGTASASTPQTSSSAGTFNITFPLKSVPIYLGNYTINAATRYPPSSFPFTTAYTKSTFNVALIADLNNDYKVDVKDVSIAAKAFGTMPGDSKWNPIADLNKDNKVDMKDISIVAKAFGAVALDP